MAEAPPVAVAPPAPGGLAAPADRLIGRERDLARLARLIGGARLLTLTGAGGVGKTRLALAIGDRLRDTFTDGVVLVEVGQTLDAARLPAAVAGAVGAPLELGRPAEESLLDYVAPRGLLLLLDGCEAHTAATARLAERLLRACPRLCLLATSRDPLGITGEISVRVPSLTAPPPHLSPAPVTLAHNDAVTFFLDRLGPTHALTLENAGVVAALTRRLDGIPLALELAAAGGRTLALERLAVALDEHLRRLPAPGEAGSPRGAIVTAVLDWATTGLPDAARLALARLSVFPAPVTAETVTTLVDATALGPLLTRGLLRPEPGTDGAPRYRLLDPVRAYAAARLGADGGEVEARGRLLAWAVALGEAADPGLRGRDQAAWRARLQADDANVQAALDWAVRAHGLTALRLAGTLWWHWRLAGAAVAGMAWLQAALAAAPPAPTWLRARALFALGDLATVAAGPADPQARAWLEESAAIWWSLRRQRGLAYTLVPLAAALQATGDVEGARARLAAAADWLREEKDAWGLAWAREAQARLAVERGEPHAARAFLEEALTLGRSLGDTAGCAARTTALTALLAPAGPSARPAFKDRD